MELLAQEELEQSRESKRGSIWTTSMFEPVLAMSRRASCAGAETAKELWRPAAGGKSDPEREKRQIH